MGFADFLAQAGRGTIVGDIAQATGGKTARQQQKEGLDAWIDNELPKYAEAIKAETDDTKIPMLGMKFMSEANKAGMPAAAIEKMLDLFVKPAQEGLQRRQAGDFYGGLANELSPQTEPLTPRAPDPMQGQQLAPETTFAPRTTPGRQFNAGDAARAGEMEARTGVKIPAHLAGLLQAPSVINENVAQADAQSALAGQRKTEQNLALEAQRARQGLPQTPIGNTGMNLQQLGLATEGRALGPYATASIPDPLEAEKRGKLIADEIQSRASAGASGAAAGASGAQADLARARADDLRTGGGTTTQTVRNATPNLLEVEMVRKRITDRANEEGVTDVAGLRKIADEYNYDLGNDVKFTPGKGWGWFGTKAAASNLGLSKRPTITESTRVRGGQQPGRAQPAQGGRQPAPAAPAMAAMPPASQHKGRTIRDTETGISYVSDGSKWIPR